MLHMQRPVNDVQRRVLNWLALDPQSAPPLSAYKTVATALQTRGLIEISRRHGAWAATLTEAGRYYQEHGRYPPAEIRPALSTTPDPPVDEAFTTAKPRRRAGRSECVATPEFEVDSPERQRAQGFKPRGDALRMPEEPDPWDARVLITVREAAWLMSLSEGEIRRAVADGEVARVYVGLGTSRYRIVYGSLLAWVNQMPRQSPRYPWWSGW